MSSMVNPAKCLVITVQASGPPPFEEDLAFGHGGKPAPTTDLTGRPIFVHFAHVPGCCSAARAGCGAGGAAVYAKGLPT